MRFVAYQPLWLAKLIGGFGPRDSSLFGEEERRIVDLVFRHRRSGCFLLLRDLGDERLGRENHSRDR